MNQTANVFHPRRNFIDYQDQSHPEIKTQEKHSRNHIGGSKVNRSIQLEKAYKGNKRGETLTDFVSRMDQGKITVPSDIISKAIQKKGKQFEWYN